MDQLNPNFQNENNEQLLAEAAIDAAHREGFATYTIDLENAEEAASKIAETMSSAQARLLAPQGLDSPDYGLANFTQRKHTIRGSDAFLGQIEAAGPNGLTAMVVTNGEGSIQMIRGRNAKEVPITKGTVVIFSADSEKYRKLPWFDIKSGGDIESIWIENDATRAERSGYYAQQHSAGAVGRRALAAALGREQSKMSRRLSRRLK